MEEMVIDPKHKEIPILMVDDDVIMHQTMKRYLKDWNVTYTFSGRDALDIIEKEQIELVIADISMPEMDGIELARRIKAKSPFIQVIIITATLEMENLLSAMEAGVNDFILKPISKPDILLAIETTIVRLIRWKSLMTDIFRKRRKEQ